MCGGGAARERASVTRKARPSAAKAAPARRHSATAFQDELKKLITALALRMNAIRSSRPPVHFGVSTPPTLPGTVGKPGTRTDFDRAREPLGGPKTSHMSMVSSAQTVFGEEVSAEQSEKEYAGIITDGAGASTKMGGRALLERTRETREENPEIILAANFAWHWKNAALDSAKKLLTVPKNAEKFAEDDSVSHAHAAAEVPASHQGKEKDRNASATSERCGRCSVPIVERVGDLFTCIVSLRDGRPARQALCRIDCQYLFPVPISSPSGPDV